MVVSFVASSQSSVVLGNNFLNTLNGIMLPSQPVSTLYGTIIVACLDDVFSFCLYCRMIGIKANQIYIYHFYGRFLLMIIFFHNGIDCTVLGPSAYHFKVVDLATFTTPFTICQESSWFMLLSAVFAPSSGDDCVFVPQTIFFMCNFLIHEGCSLLLPGLFELLHF